MSVSEFVSRDEWIEIVRKRTGSSKFEVLNVKTKRLETAGGFLGEHYLTEVTVRDCSSKSSETILNFFVKVEPLSSEGQLEIVRETCSFVKEVEALSKIFVELRSSLEENGKHMEWMCECYYTRPGVIVMEDLSVQNYRGFGFRDNLSFEHFAMTVKVVANMHSASIIYEEKHPSQPFRIDSVYKDILVEAFFRHAPDSPKHPGTQWLKVNVNTLWYLVELVRGKGALLRMKSELETVMNLLFDLEKPSQRFRNVVCQGDLKRDNILFRYENDQPVDVRLVDFQFIRYTPPANDLMCLLFLSTTRRFRAQYQEKLLALYYEQMASNLKQHGLHPEKVFPLKDFIESCNYYKNLGVIIATIYGPGTLLKEEDISHIFQSSEEFTRFLLKDRSPEVNRGFKDPFYTQQITEIINEFIEEFIEKKSHKRIIEEISAKQ